MTRPGEDSVKSTLILALDYQPSQYKLSNKLAKLLGIHTATKVDIVNGIWQYIKVCDYSHVTRGHVTHCHVIVRSEQ